MYKSHSTGVQSEKGFYTGTFLQDSRPQWNLAARTMCVFLAHRTHPFQQRLADNASMFLPLPNCAGLLPAFSAPYVLSISLSFDYIIYQRFVYVNSFL
jgi:hypothetical protein